MNKSGVDGFIKTFHRVLCGGGGGEKQSAPPESLKGLHCSPYAETEKGHIADKSESYY